VPSFCYCGMVCLLFSNNKPGIYYYYSRYLKSAQIQASLSQRRWCIEMGTWLAGEGKEVSFETAFKKPMDGNSLMFCGIEFETVGAACEPESFATNGLGCKRNV